MSIAAITFGFAYKSQYIWLFAAMTALVFWVMEAKWKQFQYCYASRIQEIEKAFGDDNFDNIVPIQIYSSWFRSWQSGDYKLSQIMFMKIVMIPYTYTIIVCVILFVVNFYYNNFFWQINPK